MSYRNICFFTLSLFITVRCFYDEPSPITLKQLEMFPAEIFKHIFYMHLMNHLIIISSGADIEIKKNALLNLMLAHRCGLTKKEQKELVADIQYRLFQGSLRYNCNFAKYFLKKCKVREKRALKIAIHKVDSLSTLHDYVSLCAHAKTLTRKQFRHADTYCFRKASSQLVQSAHLERRRWNIQFKKSLTNFKPAAFDVCEIDIRDTWLQKHRFFGEFFSCCAQNISIINLHGNCIKRVRARVFNTLPNITTLSLSGNQIQKIGTLRLSKLEVLDITNNIVEQFPSCDYLPSLTYLYAATNKIEIIKSNAFEQCPQLQEIYLQGNMIEHVRVHFPDSLQVLHLEGNRIHTIEENLFGSQLGILSIWGNSQLRLMPSLFETCTAELRYILADRNAMTQDDHLKMLLQFPQIQITP